MGGAAFGTYWLSPILRIRLRLTALLPEHNGLFGYREADEQEPPLRVD
jgi:hypothetical protein